ncbi:DMT family transporter (plasmid) [Haloferax mediterranei ATCC 33500]|nr:DMT family transporter [Haloferax mediterranei]AFK20987.1 DMT(drug/metabolite transporter) superfamily permease [Haloferax mediterranei ATCC 33500]EMA05226.1 DMT(drug/metabolite transporter) superfamily permease [Haloferax mediterranei ATCC 33500]MDX5989970.1 DMT family transporter [Haloferax mediterranei ATCC 33500]QCQ77156.1 DMT family transporter [Haloferax mediterranei ATCC 33500]
MGTRRRLALFVLASFFFGGTFVAAKAGLDYFPPLLFVALRFDIATVALFTYVAATTPRAELLPRSVRDIVGILATGVFVIGLANALLFVGQEHVSSGVGSIIFSLNPILTPVFAMVFLADERLSTRGALGMLIGLVGVALVVQIDPSNLLDGAAVWKGVVFLGAVSGALGSVLIRWADTSLSSTVRTAWALPVSALLTHGFSIASGESPAMVTWTPTALVALGYVGIFAGAMAYIAYFGLLDDVGPIHGNLVFYAVPIIATLGGSALLGESISTLTLVGFVTIFAGFAVLASGSIVAEAEGFYTTIVARWDVDNVSSASHD